jgi:hypothetical protein
MSPFVEALLAILTQLLENCPEPVETKRKWLKNPRPIHEARLWLKARASGMKGSDYRQAREELRAMQAEATDADIDDLIAQSSAA